MIDTETARVRRRAVDPEFIRTLVVGTEKFREEAREALLEKIVKATPVRGYALEEL